MKKKTVKEWENGNIFCSQNPMHLERMAYQSPKYIFLIQKGCNFFYT